MTITAKMVKDLRDITGVGMMDAKKALIETNGDFENATDWLRQKGLAKAQKKSGRIAAEGLIGIKNINNSSILIEANCETDFVARNEEFQNMINNILDHSVGKNTLDDILNTKIRPAVAKDGGNIQFKSFKDGVVKVELQGSCSGCPSSLMTLKQGVQNLLCHYVKEVKSVETE